MRRGRMSLEATGTAAMIVSTTTHAQSILNRSRKYWTLVEV